MSSREARGTSEESTGKFSELEAASARTVANASATEGGLAGTENVAETGMGSE
jgi:hypothetical protein